MIRPDSTITIGFVASDNPRSLVADVEMFLVQTREQGGLPLREGWHLITNDGEQFIIVPTGGNRKVFTGPLLELGIKDVSILVQDREQNMFDLREEIGPLEVR